MRGVARPATRSGGLAALLLAACAALVLGAPAAGASVYCVDRDPDAVFGQPLHDGVSRCVPGP